MTLVVITRLQELPTLKGVYVINRPFMRSYDVRRLDILVKTRVTISEGTPHIFALTTLIARRCIADWQPILHQEHIHRVLRYIGRVGSNVFKVVITIHQDIVNKLLIEDNSRLTL